MPEVQDVCSIPPLRHAIIDHGIDMTWPHDTLCKDATDDFLLHGEALYRYPTDNVWP